MSSILVLISEGVKDPVNSEDIFRFWSAKYWPMDGKGLGSLGQTDCFAGTLQNQGYMFIKITFLIPHQYTSQDIRHYKLSCLYFTSLITIISTGI